MRPPGPSGADRWLVTVVVPAYGSDPWLERSVASALASTGVDIEVIVVDNGGTEGATDPLAEVDGVTVVRPGRNLGFAGGCNAGLERAKGDVVFFLNQDAVLAPDALSRLAEVALEPGVGLATGSVRLADDPGRLNSSGNPFHFLGFSWSGGFGEPVPADDVRREVTGASGTGMAVRKSLLDDLGGFAEDYFAYHEDLELSLRCWLRGLTVVYVPDAVVTHRYEMSRNPLKFYLLDRNRLFLVATLYEGRTLALLLPALLATEVGMLAVAVQAGWAAQKVAGWRWLWSNRDRVRARRRLLQTERVVSDRELAPRLSSHFDAGNLVLPGWAHPLDAVVAAYWSLVRRVI
jgi:GT2 family glycosyltransferase